MLTASSESNCLFLLGSRRCGDRLRVRDVLEIDCPQSKEIKDVGWRPSVVDAPALV